MIRIRSFSKPCGYLLSLFSTPNLSYLANPTSFIPSKDIKVRGAGCFSVRAAMSTSGSSSSPAVERVVGDGEEVQCVELLPWNEDQHGGVIVEELKHMEATVFGSLLKASISHWRQQGKRGVWIKLPIELVNLVEAAVQQGFWYHHAEPNYLMLVYWIPQGDNTLPANATHRVGIGAFVMNERREVLVVQENNGALRGKDIWKFPTGVVDEGEDIYAAAVREVKEETDVDAEFVEVLAFRQSHKAYFEKSDLFFLCMLHPLSSHIKIQESEIAAAQWMPLEEYVAQPFVQTHDLMKYIVDICLTKIDRAYSGFSPVSTSNFSDKKGDLYLNRSDLKRD